MRTPRKREEVRELLKMRNFDKLRDTLREAMKIRECFKDKFWREKQGHGVN